MRWLQVLYEMTKENLVSTAPDTFQVVQGEAKAYKKLIAELTRAQSDAETTNGA